MFRIVSVHLQEQFFISCMSNVVHARTIVWLFCYYSNTTARRIRMYQIRHTAYKKTAPEDGLIPYVWLLCCYNNTTARRIRMYQIRRTAYKKTVPEDGLIQSEKCTAYTVNKV